jgi:hypothetical protein
MSAKDRLRPNSVLFWLTGLIAVGIIFIGIRFLFDPFRAALDFGVPAYGSPTLAYFWTKGSRDIVSGLLLASLLWLGVGRVVTATFLFVAALIPISDFLNVYINTHSHSQASGAMMIHGGTAVFMIVLALFILRGAATATGKQIDSVEEHRRSA